MTIIRLPINLFDWVKCQTKEVKGEEEKTKRRKGELETKYNLFVDLKGGHGLLCSYPNSYHLLKLIPLYVKECVWKQQAKRGKERKKKETAIND